MPKYIVYSKHTEHFVDEVEADSVEQARAIISDRDLDSLALDTVEFEVYDVEQA